MPSLHATSSGFVAVNQRNRTLIEIAVKQEERLEALNPRIEAPNRSPSPPTSNNFDFPSVLDYLGDCASGVTMPQSRGAISDSDDDCMAAEFPENDHRSNVESSPPHVTEEVEYDDEGDKENRSTITKTNIIRLKHSHRQNTETVEYSLDAVLREAKRHYQGRMPEFCVKKPEKTTKEVKLSGPGSLADIHFRTWCNTTGYWTLTDKVSDSYIVKHSKGKYYVWEGVETGFSQQAVAEVVKSAPNGSSRTKRANSDERKDLLIKSNSLRPRTARQSMPYTMYNMQKKFDKKGVKVSESQLEEAVINAGMASSPPLAITAGDNKRRKSVVPSIESGTADEDLTTPKILSPRPTLSPSDDVLYRTTFRTRFHGFDRASIPLNARNCPSNEALFATIKRKWALKLGQSRISYCVASFPWLNSDKNILLQEGDSDEFDCILKEIRDALARRIEEDVEIIIEIYVE